MHSPTVMVKAGLTDEARIMSGLSPVARIESPRRVLRNHVSSSATVSAMTAATSSFDHPASAPPSTPESALLAREKIVSHLNTLRVEEKPIAIRLMV